MSGLRDRLQSRISKSSTTRRHSNSFAVPLTLVSLLLASSIAQQYKKAITSFLVCTEVQPDNPRIFFLLDNETVLMRAADHFALDIVQMLLDKGASIQARNNRGRTALMSAVDAPIFGKTEIFKTNRHLT